MWIFKIVVERCTFYTFTFFKLIHISVAVLLLDMSGKESNDDVVIFSKSILDLLDNHLSEENNIFISCRESVCQEVNQFVRRE